MTPERKHIMDKDAMLLDYYREDEHRYKLVKGWSQLPAATIYRMGYLKAEKFQTSLKYINTPTYVRFHGWEEPDATARNNFMTSSTLHNYLTTDSGKNFIGGMTKISFNPIDTKMLIVAIPVIIGVIFGVLMLMGGR